MQICLHGYRCFEIVPTDVQKYRSPREKQRIQPYSSVKKALSSTYKSAAHSDQLIIETTRQKYCYMTTLKKCHYIAKKGVCRLLSLCV